MVAIINNSVNGVLALDMGKIVGNGITVGCMEYDLKMNSTRK